MVIELVESGPGNSDLEAFKAQCGPVGYRFPDISTHRDTFVWDTASCGSTCHTWGDIKVLDRFYIEHVEGEYLVIEDLPSDYPDEAGELIRQTHPIREAQWANQETGIFFEIQLDEATLAELLEFTGMSEDGGLIEDISAGHETANINRFIRGLIHALRPPGIEMCGTAELSLEYWLSRGNLYLLLTPGPIFDDMAPVWETVSGKKLNWDRARKPLYSGPELDSLPPSILEVVRSGVAAIKELPLRIEVEALTGSGWPAEFTGYDEVFVVKDAIGRHGFEFGAMYRLAGENVYAINVYGRVSLEELELIVTSGLGLNICRHVEIEAARGQWFLNSTRSLGPLLSDKPCQYFGRNTKS